MSYGDNLITNPSAETEDTSGWNVSNVTVEPGESGTHYFLLGATAYMYQTISSATIGDKPDIDFKVTIDFKLVTAQELYDSDVKGWVNIIISYTDGTKGEFRTPCVLGIDREGRNLSGGWLRAEANCKVSYSSSEIDIDNILVRIEASGLTDGLQVDQVKLEKNLETIIGELSMEDNMVASRSDEGEGSAKPPVFTFIIPGYLAVDDMPCVPIPIPYRCGIRSVYAYVHEVPVGEDIELDIFLADNDGNNAHSIWDNPVYKPQIDNGDHFGYVTNGYINSLDRTLQQNEIIYPKILQVGDEETPGADINIEVRCW